MKTENIKNFEFDTSKIIRMINKQEKYFQELKKIEEKFKKIGCPAKITVEFTEPYRVPKL